MKYLSTYDTAKCKNVRCGYIEGGEYHRKVNNRHFMVKEHGYGIQTDILSQLLAKGIKRIVIHAKTRDLIASVSLWVTRGHKKDYGNGEQFFLSTEFMG